MGSSDDGFGNDPAEGSQDEMDRHGDAIHELVMAYADEHDISMGATSFLLLTVAVKMHMVAYGLETEKPSVAGLKLDLDRFGRELSDMVRDAKKGADQFIERVKTELAAVEDEDGEP